GTVTSFENRGVGPMYLLGFSFKDAAGVQHTGESSIFFAHGICPPIAVGDEVAVLYYPAEPQHARLDLFNALWIDPLVIFGVGLLFWVGCRLLSIALNAAIKQ